MRTRGHKSSSNNVQVVTLEGKEVIILGIQRDHIINRLTKWVER